MCSSRTRPLPNAATREGAATRRTQREEDFTCETRQGRVFARNYGRGSRATTAIRARTIPVRLPFLGPCELRLAALESGSATSGAAVNLPPQTNPPGHAICEGRPLMSIDAKRRAPRSREVLRPPPGADRSNRSAPGTWCSRETRRPAPCRPAASRERSSRRTRPSSTGGGGGCFGSGGALQGSGPSDDPSSQTTSPSNVASQQGTSTSSGGTTSQQGPVQGSGDVGSQQANDVRPWIAGLQRFNGNKETNGPVTIAKADYPISSDDKNQRRRSEPGAAPAGASQSPEWGAREVQAVARERATPEEDTVIGGMREGAKRGRARITG